MFGAGRIAPLHARTLAGAPDVSSVSLTDAVPERAAEVAARLGLQHVPSRDEALSAADAVVITPGHRHGHAAGRCQQRRRVRQRRV